MDLGYITSPDYVSEDLIIYNNIGKERKFIREQYEHQRVYQTSSFTFSICQQGNSEIIVDACRFPIKKNCILVILPEQIVEVFNTSHDYRASLISISGEYFKEHFKRTIPLLSSIKKQSVMELKDDDIRILEWYKTLLSKRTSHPNKLYYDIIMHNLIHALFYEIYGLIVQQTKNFPLDSSHKSNTFKQFIILVKEHYQKERSIIFYADKLCLTPKYLSAVIHEVSGKFAGEWIDDQVITLAKSLLTSSMKTVQEVSYDLNFTTPSSFTKYFKRITGNTPREYRNKRELLYQDQFPE